MGIACPGFLVDAVPGLCRTFDAYCERTSDALDAEPLNALTNIGMLVAAFAAMRLQRRRPNRDAAGLIVAMVTAIVAGGVGAFLFHTTAAVWAVVLDMLPFLIFMLLVLWLTLTRFFGWTAAMAAAGIAAFIGVMVGGGMLIPQGFVPAGAYYLPPLAVLSVVGVVLLLRRSPAGPSYFSAALVFAAAFTARELDGPLCETIPVGTHFLWHLLAAVLAFILIRAAVLYAPPRKQGNKVTRAA
ncbi:MAG TPA: ceramidase domain-containing protein [Bauldia sp.]|nr:ceramidase domain-containing protein [Bauldia sp.]